MGGSFPAFFVPLPSLFHRTQLGSIISQTSKIFPRDRDLIWTISHDLGALLTDVPKEGGPLDIQGSAMVAVAASKEDVIEFLKKDIYSTSGVWDFSKVRCHSREQFPSVLWGFLSVFAIQRVDFKAQIIGLES